MDGERKVGATCFPISKSSDASRPSAGGDGGTEDSDPGAQSNRDAKVDSGRDSNATPSKLTCGDCDPAAMCSEGAERVCTCPAASTDVRGDGTECIDPCDAAKCDSNASCTVTAGSAKCTCTAPYVGDGASCTFDESCSLLACDENAECTVTGMTRACKCRAGYTGSGTSCTNVDECATAAVCGANGKCIDSPGAYACSCNPGFSGAKCEIDACTVTSCQAGSSCQHSPLGVSCVPACAPECPAGTACTTDDQCVSGAVCHPTGRVCVLNSCAGGKVAFQGDIDRIKYCASLSGTLTIQATGSDPIEWNAPYLKSITGGLVSTAAGEVKTSSIQLEALESIGGDLQMGLVSGVATLSLPQLRSVGGSFAVGMSNFSSVNVGRLETVGKDLVLFGLDRANSISIAAIQTITGAVTINSLPGVPWSSIRHLAKMGSSQSISTVGCSICPSTAETAYMCVNGTGC